MYVDDIHNTCKDIFPDLILNKNVSMGQPLFCAPTSPKVMRPTRAFSKLMAQSLHAVEHHFGLIGVSALHCRAAG